MSDERFPSEPREEGAMRPSSEEEDATEGGPRVPIRVRDKRIRHTDDPAEGATEEAGRADEAGDAPEEEPDEPEGDDDPVEGLKAELREAKRVADERLDQAKRYKADLENYRRRAIREQTEVVERASQRLVERLLPVLDDFERAIDAARGAEGAEGLVKGVELVFGSLRDALREEGVERVGEAGEPFDPRDHEAVSSQPGDVEDPVVAQVVRPGYKLKDRTIRPAMVHVTVPASDAPAEEADGSDEEEDE